MSPPSSPSSGCTSHYRSSIWDYYSPTECTAASEGAPSSADDHDLFGLGIPHVGPVHALGGAFPGEPHHAVGGGLSEAQSGFVQDWLDGVGVFGPGPGVEIPHPAVPTPEQTVPPGPPTQDLAIVPSASSLDVELDNVPPSPILFDSISFAHDPLPFPPGDIEALLLGVGGAFI